MPHVADATGASGALGSVDALGAPAAAGDRWLGLGGRADAPPVVMVSEALAQAVAPASLLVAALRWPASRLTMPGFTQRTLRQASAILQGRPAALSPNDAAALLRLSDYALAPALCGPALAAAEAQLTPTAALPLYRLARAQSRVPGDAQAGLAASCAAYIAANLPAVCRAQRGAAARVAPDLVAAALEGLVVRATRGRAHLSGCEAALRFACAHGAPAALAPLRTPLHVAWLCEGGHAAALADLMAATGGQAPGAQELIAAADGLCLAAAGGHAEVVEVLLAPARVAPADADALRTEGACAAFVAACAAGHLAAVEALWAGAGAPARARLLLARDGQTLELAARGGHLAVVAWWLARRAECDVALPGDAVCAALVAAAQADHAAVVRLLAAHDDDPGALGCALYEATLAGRKRCVEVLLEVHGRGLQQSFSRAEEIDGIPGQAAPIFPRLIDGLPVATAALSAAVASGREDLAEAIAGHFHDGRGLEAARRCLADLVHLRADVSARGASLLARLVAPEVLAQAHAALTPEQLTAAAGHGHHGVLLQALRVAPARAAPLTWDPRANPLVAAAAAGDLPLLRGLLAPATARALGAVMPPGPAVVEAVRHGHAAAARELMPHLDLRLGERTAAASAALATGQVDLFVGLLAPLAATQPEVADNAAFLAAIDAMIQGADARRIDWLLRESPWRPTPAVLLLALLSRGGHAAMPATGELLGAVLRVGNAEALAALVTAATESGAGAAVTRLRTALRHRFADACWGGLPTCMWALAQAPTAACRGALWAHFPWDTLPRMPAPVVAHLQALAPAEVSRRVGPAAWAVAAGEAAASGSPVAPATVVANAVTVLAAAEPAERIARVGSATPALLALAAGAETLEARLHGLLGPQAVADGQQDLAFFVHLLHRRAPLGTAVGPHLLAAEPATLARWAHARPDLLAIALTLPDERALAEVILDRLPPATLRDCCARWDQADATTVSFFPATAHRLATLSVA